MNPRNNRRAFTLIELLLVLVILSILASIVTVSVVQHVETARRTGTITDIARLKTALDTFQLNCGRLPTTAEGLEALVTRPPDLEGSWQGPYIELVPLDKWERPYHYVCPGVSDPRSYDLYSAGKDGVEGTDDDITKLTRK